MTVQSVRFTCRHLPKDGFFERIHVTSTHIWTVWNPHWGGYRTFQANGEGTYFSGTGVCTYLHSCGIPVQGYVSRKVHLHRIKANGENEIGFFGPPPWRTMLIFSLRDRIHLERALAMRRAECLMGPRRRTVLFSFDFCCCLIWQASWMLWTHRKETLISGSFLPHVNEPLSMIQTSVW